MHFFTHSLSSFCSTQTINTCDVHRVTDYTSIYHSISINSLYMRYLCTLLERNKILGVCLSVKEHHEDSRRRWIISDRIEPSWRFLQTTLTVSTFAGQNTSLVYVLQPRGISWTISIHGVGS